MRLPVRLSVLCFIGVLVAGSSALGYYYLYVYAPPLEAAAAFLDAMETGEPDRVARTIVMNVGRDVDDLRPPTDEEVAALIADGFTRGRILDQRKREGATRTFHYLVYREPDGQIFALVATEVEGGYRVVIPEDPMSDRRIYLWDYTWTN